MATNWDFWIFSFTWLGRSVPFDSTSLPFQYSEQQELIFAGENYSFKILNFIPQLHKRILSRIMSTYFVVFSQRGTHSQLTSGRLIILPYNVPYCWRKNLNLSCFCKMKYHGAINKEVANLTTHGSTYFKASILLYEYEIPFPDSLREIALS